MSHVEFDRLWAFNHDELGTPEADLVRAHLATCADCSGKLESMRTALPFMAPPPVPELSEERWKALDERIFQAAAEEMHRPNLWRTLLSFWDAPTFKPVFATAALAAAILIVFLVSRPAKQPEIAVVLPAPTERHQASVLSTIESESGTSALTLDHKLAVGAVIATRARGEAWLKLPDGTRLGVLAATRASLRELSPEAVKISLEQGAVAVSGTHEPEHHFEVLAGRLTVRAIGTRFIVMRDGETSGVAVEEGMVEAGYDGKTTDVPAGSSLTLGNQGAIETARIDEPERQQIKNLVPKTAVPVRKPQPKIVPVAQPDARQVVAVEIVPDASAEPWVALPPRDAAVAQALPGLPEPPELIPVVDALDAGKRSWVQERLEKIRHADLPFFDVPAEKVPEMFKNKTDEGYCRHVSKEVEELLAKRPDGGGSARDEKKLRDALEEQAKCLERGKARPPTP